MMGMVRFLKEYKPHKELWLQTASGKTYKVSVIYPIDDKRELIPLSIFKCDFCPPKYSFKDGNCKYQFKKPGVGLELNEKIVHYLESHPEKIPREWLVKLASFFGETSKL